MSSISSEVVLYAEDNQDDIYFMQRAFKKAGLSESLHIVCNGAEAISYLSGQTINLDGAPPSTIVFILLDIKMPRVSGLEVLSWIRKNLGKDVPVFMLSSSSQARDIEEALASSANGYLLKPANAGRLSEALIFIRNFCSERSNVENCWIQFEGEKLISKKLTSLP